MECVFGYIRVSDVYIADVSFRQRIREHELAVAKQEDNTSITKYAKETAGHIFDLKNTKILAQTNYKKIREYREAIEIYQMKEGAVNGRNEYTKLAITWKFLTVSSQINKQHEATTHSPTRCNHLWQKSQGKQDIKRVP